MKYFLFILAIFFSMNVSAGGDKNRTANPIIGTGNCIYEAPIGLDLDKCQFIVASETGQITYLCDFESFVICPEEADNQGRN